MRPAALLLVVALQAKAHDGGTVHSVAPTPGPLAATAPGARPKVVAAFGKFPRVRATEAGEWIRVESDGMPDHPMMIGITNWQQQVPLPQSYQGSNAWLIPREPKPAATPTPLANRFLRGAVALAVNGIPIFNPQNNRGEVAQDIGELDRWGGHCGRADDYHYHVVPLHLQEQAGKGNPLAVALDGYPVYGPTEPDGSAMRPLDACGGHEDAKAGYHYHATGKAPYVFAAFRGTVREVEEQVDPQPRARPVRPAGAPLRGAVITGFDGKREGAGGEWTLAYEVGGSRHALRFRSEGPGKASFWLDGKPVAAESKEPRGPENRRPRR